MKRACALVLIAGLVGFTGCNNKGTQGGPGASHTGDKTRLGQAEETFSLSMPTFSTKLKQSESKVVDIGIKRGKNFNEDVTLKFSDMPKGVTIEPASSVLKHDDNDVKVTVKAADDAAVGDFTVKVTGHPTKGSDAVNDLKLTVQKK